MSNLLTVGQVTRRLGIDYWKLRELIVKGELGELSKFGGKFVIPETLLPKIEKIIKERGWDKD